MDIIIVLIFFAFSALACTSGLDDRFDRAFRRIYFRIRDVAIR